MQYSVVAILLFLLGVQSGLHAQTFDRSHATKSEFYMRQARLIATVPLTFPGGYTLAHFPVREITKYGDTLAIVHAFLINVGTANEGDFIPHDSTKLSAGYVGWEFPVTPEHTIHVQLAPTNTHLEYRELDSTYFGMLGYAFLKQFVTVFDFRKNTLSLYTLYSSIDIADRDTSVIQGPYLDDEFLTYCHCPYPTIWLEGEAPPLKAGHVHLELEAPHSQIFQPALDKQTSGMLEKKAKADSVMGRKALVGLSLAQFKIWGKNLAPMDPHRFVVPMPPAMKDLSAPVMGTLGTDVLRNFDALIIDPVRSRLILLKPSQPILKIAPW